MFRILFHIIIVQVLFINSLPVYAIEGVALPLPGSMVDVSHGFKPACLVGIQVDINNPFRFNFFMDQGDELLSGEALTAESERLVKYFLAAMTVPEEEQWVNLSPYEDKRIVSENFARTEMGRDLLAQDYMLKQIMASLVYPEAPLGKKFWTDVYRRAQEAFGTTDIPFDVFNKVWISPDKAAFYENGNIAMLANARMKVALERDYLAEKVQSGNSVHNEAEENQVQPGLREIILPVIEKEINDGESFALLRKIYYSMALAAWYKRKVKEGILYDQYVDKGKTDGVNLRDPKVLNEIYQQYMAAFRQGVFSYIKEEADPFSGDPLLRKYFSGGFAPDFDKAMERASLQEISSNLFANNPQGLIRVGVLVEPQDSRSDISTDMAQKPDISRREATPDYILRLSQVVVKTFLYQRTSPGMATFFDSLGTSVAAFNEDLENTRRRFLRGFVTDNVEKTRLLKSSDNEDVYAGQYGEKMIIIRKITNKELWRQYWQQPMNYLLLNDLVLPALGPGVHQVVLEIDDSSLERQLQRVLMNFSLKRFSQLIHLGRSKPVQVEGREKTLIMKGVQQEYVGSGGNHDVYKNQHMAIRAPIRMDTVLKEIKDGFRIVEQEGVGPAWVAVIKATNGRELLAVEWMSGDSLDKVIAAGTMNEDIIKALIRLFRTLVGRGILINDPRAANFILQSAQDGTPEVLIVDADLVEYANSNPYDLALKYSRGLIPEFAGTWGGWDRTIAESLEAIANDYRSVKDSKDHWSQDVLHKRIADASQAVEPVGGIDMSTRNMKLDIANDGGPIHFNIDSATLPAVRAGLSPRIIGIDRIVDPAVSIFQ